MKYFEFSQNNSGGSFVEDENLGEYVLIEAEDLDKAIEIAEEIGIYFNGVTDERDCPCCGDRWYYPDEITLPYDISKASLYCYMPVQVKVLQTIEEYCQFLIDRGRVFTELVVLHKLNSKPVQFKTQVTDVKAIETDR